jgi:GrpB-like predicted nucleotidyltransferase (UPF0157 family)
MRKIEVIPYNPLWPELFNSEAALIRKALGENCIEIYHVGSTAVPGLSAKPVIDMIPVVKDIIQVDFANDAMKALGYEPQGEFGIPFRRYFQKGGDNRTHHVHVFELGLPEIERHIRFRDWMRMHEGDRNAYGELKQHCALQFPYDSNGYCNGKDSFIRAIDEKAMTTKTPRLMFVCTDREWEEYHELCAQLFDGLEIVYDRNHPNFKNSDYFHFVLYVGTKIVTAAQLERLNEHEWAVRFLITRSNERGKGYGTVCMHLLEKWMKQQKANIIHLHAEREVGLFYRTLGYVDMPWTEDKSIDPDAIDLGKKL